LDRTRHRARERGPRPSESASARTRARPRRRPALRALLLCTGLAAGACGREAARTERPPNVVVYLVDTLRKDHLSVYGYPRETSPRLAEFARDAVRFETAYSPTSWTRPAVASLLTGLTPLRHGAVTRADRLDPRVNLLPQYLGPAGYHSAAFVTNANVHPVWGFARGFDAFVDLRQAEQPARADEINEAVFEHLDAAEREPFFLYVHTVDPHFPYRAPPPFDASFPRPGRRELRSPDPEVAARARLARVVANYDAEIRFNDHEFGRLLDFLDARGLYRDALVVFTADHGEELRDHGELGHGFGLFEEVVQVPLLVKLPGNAHAGRVVRTPASLLDVVPTILRAVGSEPAAGVEGVDLLELLRAEDAGEPISRPLFLDLDVVGIAAHHTLAAGVVSGAYKLLELREPRADLLLFDLARDPGERQNAAPETPALAEHLRGLLAEQRSRSEAGVHLWIANANDEATREVRATLRTNGRFAALRALQLEKGDRVELAPDRRRLVLQLTLQNRRNPFPEPPLRLVDQERLVFSVEPPTASIEIEAFTVDGAPGSIFLGQGGRPAPATPLVLDASAPELRVERMETLFPASAEASSLAALGAYLGVIERETVPSVVLDPDVEARLRALGYGK
jgi:arylsulfatase